MRGTGSGHQTYATMKRAPRPAPPAAANIAAELPASPAPASRCPAPSPTGSPAAATGTAGPPSRPACTGRTTSGPARTRKTATRILSDEQLADYGPWFDNHKRLRELIAELEELSLAITEADPRWNR